MNDPLYPAGGKLTEIELGVEAASGMGMWGLNIGLVFPK